MLWRHKTEDISKRWLIALPLIALIWINTHIYFFFGPFLIGLFWLEHLLSKHKDKLQKIKELSTVFIFTIVASLFNPIGFKVLLYPLNIFKNYGYRIVENQSVWFLENLDFLNISNLLLFKISFYVLVASFVVLLIINRKRFSLALFILSTTLSIMAWLAIRNFTMFGLFALPIIAYNIKGLEPQNFKLKTGIVDSVFAILILIVTVLGITNTYQHIITKKSRLGFGLASENNSSVEFFRKENISGPILNNYDIGGFLIYHLYPLEKVFTDNRPEAYPNEFFEDVYVPMQQNDKIWKEQDAKYNFNVIFFSHRDYTPWGQQFLTTRVADENWASVFVDEYAIILLKRNEANASIIEKYELPKETFGIK
ncbi:hypothetical protein ACFLZC_02200 [Patescibacteria group bacterium]